MSDKLELSKTWFKRVWAEEDPAAIDEIFVPDVGDAAKGLGEKPLAGPSEFKEFHKSLLSHIKNVDIQVQRFAEDGDWLSVLCVLSARCRKTDKPVEVTGQILIRIDDGKFREAYNQFDFWGLFEQLGKIPSQSMDRCLAGESFVT